MRQPSQSLLPVHPRTGLTALWVRPDGRAMWPIAGADGRTPGNPVLVRLLEQRSEQETFIDQLLARVWDEGRDLVDAERSNLKAAQQRIGELDAQIEPLEAFEAARSAHRSAAPVPTRAPANRGGEPQQQAGPGTGLTIAPREVVYASAGEFIVDAIRARGFPGIQLEPDAEAAQRVAAALATRANQTTTDTPGLMPETIVGSILTDLDASRPFVASVAGPFPLAAIPGEIFTRPHVTQHTQTGEQTGEKQELPSRQFKVEGIPFNKRTFGGWLNVSRQSIDWTSPSAWNALLTDLQNEYGADTDDTFGEEFADGVTQGTGLGATETAATIDDWVDALYAAAVIAATANNTTRPRALRLPNHIWTSIDMWASVGAAIDKVRAQNSESRTFGTASPTSFQGSLMDMPRTMVAGFPLGTCVVGRDNLYEFYEERIGVLQAIEPKVLGVEVAYGGYAAGGFLDATAFCKVTPETVAPGG